MTGSPSSHATEEARGQQGPARIQASYHVRSDASAIEARARTIAVEQSVEMPLAAIDDAFVRGEIVGRVEEITQRRAGEFAVRISLSAATVGDDPGQLLNMLFGNSSLQEDVRLHDVALPSALVRRLGGPHFGVGGLRARVGAPKRALTCSALKPQGLSGQQLADLARRFAQGGIDYIKDDHGLADQAYAPFAARVAAVGASLRALGDRRPRYAPSLSGDLDAMRTQLAAAREAGLDAVVVAPMVCGLANFHRLVRDHADFAFLAHPSLGGAARIAPQLLLGRLFRVLGADAVVFPHHGGRFGYSLDTCRRVAETARSDEVDLLPCLPVPAGGMSVDRVGEMLDFYGPDVMLLIGGALLEARERLEAATVSFVSAVHNHAFGSTHAIR